ncbi:hypothetical protein H310_06720 [Aphanomyces invadans]|uniref:Uncharacterized protein n=1 Tax=Aphanomyces invadans TaxID=157072 RepID=A0A024U4E4_9STRA|nr:hypothetical protein H310_06720 [Aphanomyces invadans]ETW01105.1 hypothetical protein H310_06720 [Aphanomyces invadans]|eukprot:XP_008870103.1 hypothetical protein H310_06720 [Aphanomyces invadans]
METDTMPQGDDGAVAAAHVDAVESLDKALYDQDNSDSRELEDVLVQEFPEGYIPFATKLGLALDDGSTSNLIQVESFDVLKAKVRQLALHSGFQVKLDGRSDKRRQWKCTSRRNCPFTIVGNRNRYGIFVKPRLGHNHAFHVHEAMNKRFTTGTTHELACIVRRSPLFANHDLFHISGMQIAKCIFDVTGFHINQMRASRIKRLLLDEPDRYLPCPDTPPSSSTPSLVPKPLLPPSLASTGASQGTPDSVAWECFVVLANDPHVLSTLGVANVRKMVATFKREMHKPTLRAILRMSVRDPTNVMPPSLTGNRPLPSKFVDVYQRQVTLGFFDDVMEPQRTNTPQPTLHATPSESTDPPSPATAPSPSAVQPPPHAA